MKVVSYQINAGSRLKKTVTATAIFSNGMADLVLVFFVHTSILLPLRDETYILKQFLPEAKPISHILSSERPIFQNKTCQ